MYTTPRIALAMFIMAFIWKRLKGKNPEGKNFRKLLRRKQSSAKISKISRYAIKSSKSDIFYLLRNLLKYLLRTFFLPRSFQKFLPFAFLPSGSFRFMGVVHGLWGSNFGVANHAMTRHC